MTIAPAAPRLGYLDGIRGLAALAIALLNHWSLVQAPTLPGAPMIDVAGHDLLFKVLLFGEQYGHYSVDVFFFVSGIVFHHVYYDSLASGALSLRQFFVARFARLYPLHALTLVLCALIIGISCACLDLPGTNTPPNFLLNLIMLQTGIFNSGSNSFNSPAWSLSIEVVMYALFFVAARRHAGWLAPVLFVSLGLTIWFAGLTLPVLNMPVGRGLVGFFAGFAIYRAAVVHKKGVLALVVVMALLLASAGILAHAGPQADLLLPVVWEFIAAFILMVMLSPILQKVLGCRPLRLLGDLSLGVYLIHYPVLLGMIYGFTNLKLPLPTDQDWFWGAYALTVLTMAALLHYLYEVPMRQWVRRALSGARPSPSPALNPAE